MTEGLGIEITPGRVPTLSQAGRPLVGADDFGIADGLADVADLLSQTFRDTTGRHVLHPGTFSSTTRSSHATLEAKRRDAPIGAGPRARSWARVDAPRRGAETGRCRHGGRPRRHRRAPFPGLAGHRSPHRRPPRHSRHGTGFGRLGGGIGAGRSALALRMAPVDVGPVLAGALWPKVTAVLTSATVPPLLEARLGLPVDRTDRLDVGSPFPYETCALLYCALALPDRRSPVADAAIHDELVRLVEAAGGRTLALFTSWRRHAGGGRGRPPPPHVPRPGPKRPAQDPPGRGLRRRARGLPVRHHVLLAGDRRAGGHAAVWWPSTVSRSPGPTTPSSRPDASGPGRAPSGSSTSRAPPPCWPRALVDSSGSRHRCRRRGRPRPAPGHRRLPTQSPRRAPRPCASPPTPTRWSPSSSTSTGATRERRGPRDPSRSTSSGRCCQCFSTRTCNST